MFGRAFARIDAVEFLDDPDAFAGDVPANLADIRFLNSRFGATRLMVRAVEAATRGLPVFSLLDVATGSADIPLAIWRRFSPEKEVAVTALDSSRRVLDVARSFLGEAPISLTIGDARRLPFADSSFDVLTCSLALHHFSPDSAVDVLGEMYRVCRRTTLVADLARSRLGHVAVWMLSHTLARNRLTRHDAPLSVLRAYRSAELLDLAHAAGIDNARIDKVPFFRQLLTLNKVEL